MTPLYFDPSSRQSDLKQTCHASETREFLRKMIGKHVKVTIDLIRPKEGVFDVVVDHAAAGSRFKYGHLMSRLRKTF